MSSERFIGIAFWVIILLTIPSCDTFFKEEFDRVPIARVGTHYLYLDDIDTTQFSNLSEQDSTALISSIVNKWASQKLLLDKSRINLSEETMSEFDRMVENYKTELYTQAYIENLTRSFRDTLVKEEELEEFYRQEKENFRLSERILQLRFLQVPEELQELEEVRTRLDRFGDEDKVYLDSMRIHFNKVHLDQGTWVTASRLMLEIPTLNYQNFDRYMKPGKSFEIKAFDGIYIGRVTGSASVNDLAPYDFIKPELRQLFLNRKRLKYIRELETEILSEATQSKEYERY